MIAFGQTYGASENLNLCMAPKDSRKATLNRGSPEKGLQTF